MQSLTDTNVDMQIVTRDQNAQYRGTSNDQAVGTPVPTEGQELSLRPPSEIAVPETSREQVLIKQVSALAEALNFEEQVVHHRTHEVQVSAGIKVRSLMKARTTGSIGQLPNLKNMLVK